MTFNRDYDIIELKKGDRKMKYYKFIQNAQDYEYDATGWNEDWESEEEMETYKDWYFEISEEEGYNENVYI